MSAMTPHFTIHAMCFDALIVFAHLSSHSRAWKGSNMAESWLSAWDPLACAEKRIADLEEQLLEAQGALATEREQREIAEKESARLRDRLDGVTLTLTDALKEYAKLQADLQIQKGISSVMLSHRAYWQYEMDGSWHALPPEGNDKMLEAYIQYLHYVPGSRHVIITSGGVDRLVDFELMQQRHATTNKVRKVRILPGVPAQWVTQTEALLLQQGNDLEVFYVEVFDPKIYDSVGKILRLTGHVEDSSTMCSCMRTARIRSVHRIENYRLWHRYKARLAMRQDHASSNIAVASAALDLDGHDKIMTRLQSIFDCGEALAHDVDEKILLHGTSWDNADSIVQNGFDNRTCQRGMYGAGVYFASAGCKSHQYTCTQHTFCCGCDCERTLIIARVALGDAVLATETRYDERRPPVRSNSSGTHDSIVVYPGPIRGHHRQNQLHQEYVIFDREQAYPSYVVQYELWRKPFVQFCRQRMYLRSFQKCEVFVARFLVALVVCKLQRSKLAIFLLSPTHSAEGAGPAITGWGQTTCSGALWTYASWGGLGSEDSFETCWNGD